MDAPSRDIALLLLRLAGFGMAWAHGYGKIVALASGETRFVEGVAALGFPYPLVFAWAAAVAECAGGILVGLGLFTRIAAAFAAFTMLVAAFGRHRAHSHLLTTLGLSRVDDETRTSWGNPELALLYLACFLAVALLGPGRIAVDRYLAERRARRR